MQKKRIKKILILGSGGLKIGQAGEFDYSGSQAIKALKEEGIKVVVLNPNIATIQTDPGFADTIYFLPVTAHFATRVIRKERPDGILLGFGGQTALNTGLELHAKGILKKYHVEVLGTPIETIRATEDRGLFIKKLNAIDVKTATSAAVTTVAKGLTWARRNGYPVMIRSAYALGGAHSGVVRNKDELRRRLKEAFTQTKQMLIEEYLEGWKEIEYEVVRDSNDTCITVCNMENIDPMGIHTGESIVVAPSQTLSNEEYHFLRSISIKTVRYLGVVGECNIQFAVNPKTFDYRVIEINARLSRSSALASKATGYPLAHIAAKLALGYSLAALPNSITKVTKACFEPALDYLVLKVPRWDLQKFQRAYREIGSEMKSVGEVMAIGRSFEEVLQKALRMLGIGAEGLVANTDPRFAMPNYLRELSSPTDKRIFAIAEALRQGMSVEKIHARSYINQWFLEKMKNIVMAEKSMRKQKLTAPRLRSLKQLGFSDKQIAHSTKKNENAIRRMRHSHNITPVIKQIDTLAGEFPAQTNYLYLTYHGDTNDVARSKNSVIVLGSGPYCIGSSVEFDWCSVQAVKALKTAGFTAISINNNPETVSTDYDVTDRLYFDELSIERILDIYAFEKSRGVIVSTGGQIPNNLALRMHREGIRILGTRPEDIDRAEDRHKFSQLLDTLHVDQPLWKEVVTEKQAKKNAEDFGYPVLIRPSYVLSGTAMNVAYEPKTLQKYLRQAADVSTKHPVVISKFIENAREIEIDGVAQNGTLIVSMTMEHVENAGTHSGDATIVIPPQKTYLETARRAKEITKKIVQALHISGPFNIQFVAKDNEIKVIECNVRASRSFPFVSKTLHTNFIDIATKIMVGAPISKKYNGTNLRYSAVKSPQFSYGRLKGADPVSYVEMASTGEVACFGDSYYEALLKSMLSSGFRIPEKSILLTIGGEKNKLRLLPKIKKLAAMGYTFYATEGTADFLRTCDVASKKVFKIQHKKHPSVLNVIEQGKVDLIINIPKNYLSRNVNDGYILRRRAIDLNVSLISNMQIAEAFVGALDDCSMKDLQTKSWDEYIRTKKKNRKVR